jgi:hypothetical protein
VRQRCDGPFRIINGLFKTADLHGHFRIEIRSAFCHRKTTKPKEPEAKQGDYLVGTDENVLVLNRTYANRSNAEPDHQWAV